MNAVHVAFIGTWWCLSASVIHGHNSDKALRGMHLCAIFIMIDSTELPYKLWYRIIQDKTQIMAANKRILVECESKLAIMLKQQAQLI